MPIYAYSCQNCDRTFEHFSSSMNSTTTPECPQCGEAKAVEKQLSIPSALTEMSKSPAAQCAGDRTQCQVPM